MSYLIHFPVPVAIYYRTLVSGPVDCKRKPVFWTYLSPFRFEKPLMKWRRMRPGQRKTTVPAAVSEPVAKVAAT